MAKELNINNTYYRNNPNFSLAPKGQEVNIEADKCNFFTDRAAGASVKYIVQTYSVGSLKSTLSKMIVPAGGEVSKLRGEGVSVHYIIDKDGTIYHLVPDDKKPWAAGAGDLVPGSKLNPGGAITNAMNDNCISIMSINNGKEPFTEAQKAANIALTKQLMQEHNVDSQNAIALADWAAGRHIAPGPFFPWAEFAENSIGFWHNQKLDPNADVVVSWQPNVSRPLPEEVEDVAQRLEELGMGDGGAAAGGALAVALKGAAKLTNKFTKWGTVGKTNAEEDLAYSSIISSAVSFNLHFLGAQILGNEHYEHGFQNLWNNSGNRDARAIVGEWTTSSDKALDFVLDGVSGS